MPRPPGVTETDQSEFRALLIARGWTTRKEVCEALGWDERKLRAVAQSLGGEVVRCQLGYKLTAHCASREDLGWVKQAADAAASQARWMRAYEIELRKFLHAHLD